DAPHAHRTRVSHASRGARGARATHSGGARAAHGGSAAGTCRGLCCRAGRPGWGMPSRRVRAVYLACATAARRDQQTCQRGPGGLPELLSRRVLAARVLTHELFLAASAAAMNVWQSTPMSSEFCQREAGAYFHLAPTNSSPTAEPPWLCEMCSFAAAECDLGNILQSSVSEYSACWVTQSAHAKVFRLWRLRPGRHPSLARSSTIFPPLFSCMTNATACRGGAPSWARTLAGQLNLWQRHPLFSSSCMLMRS